jgi:hypothetical protein
MLYGLGHHGQVTNIMDMLEVKQRDEITNETRGEDGEPPASQASQLGWFAPLVGLADTQSRLSPLPLPASH